MGFVSGIQPPNNMLSRRGRLDHHAEIWCGRYSDRSNAEYREGAEISIIRLRPFYTYLLISDSFRTGRNAGVRRTPGGSVPLISIWQACAFILRNAGKISQDTVAGKHADERKVVEEYNKEHDIDNSVLVNGRRWRPIWSFRLSDQLLRSLPSLLIRIWPVWYASFSLQKPAFLELYFFLPTKYGLLTKATGRRVRPCTCHHSEFDLRVFRIRQVKTCDR